MNLAIDVGNSYTKCTVFNKGDIQEIYAFQHFNAEEIKTVFSQYKIKNGIISNNKNEEITLELKNRLPNLLILDENTPLPIENLYQTPNTLGKDRIASAVGAWLLNPNSNTLVIDAGTAITIDFINEKNQYIGGNISPGIQIRFAALHNYTANLPLLDLSDQFGWLGKNSYDAVLNGVLNGVIFEVEGYINKMKENYKALKVIITGGNAVFFDKKLKNIIFVDQNLVFKGLNKILEYNA
jgi:type III pantothenate kinase